MKQRIVMTVSPDGTTSHSTRLPKDDNQVAGYLPYLPMNLNRTVGLEGRPLSLDARCRAERLRFRRMIFAGRNGILNNGGTPRKGASALHTEAIANTATAFRFMDSIRAKKIGDCGLSRRARGTMSRYASRS